MLKTLSPVKPLPMAIVLASGLLSGQALAQLEEVVVTAQKKVESLQDTPLSVVAFSESVIHAHPVNSVTTGVVL